VDKTIVVFRVWRAQPKTCIALFPMEEERYGDGRRCCGSYEHVGQHGAADYRGVMQATRPAKPDEYAALKRELESAPYNYVFDVRERKPRA
jgi:hypothetical protein